MKIDYKVRSTLVFLFCCTLYGIILVNLYFIQIKQRTFFEQLGRNQYNVMVETKPPRALIYDRNGNYLALNKDMLSAFVTPKNITSWQTLEPFLREHFPQALERLEKNSVAHFLFIKRKLTDEEVQLIQESNLFDIKLLSEPHRFYPVASMGPIIGLTDIDNNGLFGIELLFNDVLAGSPTTSVLEKDARSGHFYFKKETKVQGKEGDAIRLTLDSDLQFLAYEDLKETLSTFNAKEGAVLVMNPSNGEILAMVNYPDFDPNDTKDLNLEYTKNKIVTEAYELGSVMKVFVALAALEEEQVTPDELVDCENSKTTWIDGIRVNTWKAHGLIPFEQVVQNSNNIGMAKVARRVGDALYEHYCKVGFGSKTGIQWPGEQKGFVNHPKNWTKPSIISLSFGYEISATLLQLAKAFCMIANHGIPVRPTLIMHEHKQSDEGFIEPLYSENSMDEIRTILEQTVTQGTARKAALNGYTVMGKTGTANMLINGVYCPDRNIYTFVGIIEKDNYKRVIVTFIKDAQQKDLYASSVAAPLFERIAENLVIHDNVISKES